MERFNLFPQAGAKQLKPGQLLIAQPLLKDPNFTRSVILLCEHSHEGSVGFVLNQLTDFTLDDIISDIFESHINIYQGGPVQADTLHLLHSLPHAINGGKEIAEGIYWGGSFEELKHHIWSSDFDPAALRIFIGYSGWAPGQLENELKKGTWLVTEANDQLLFDTDPGDIWKKAIELLGRKYAYLANMPTDPQMN